MLIQVELAELDKLREALKDVQERHVSFRRWAYDKLVEDMPDLEQLSVMSLESLVEEIIRRAKRGPNAVALAKEAAYLLTVVEGLKASRDFALRALEAAMPDIDGERALENLVLNLIVRFKQAQSALLKAAGFEIGSSTGGIESVLHTEKELTKLRAEIERLRRASEAWDLMQKHEISLNLIAGNHGWQWRAYNNGGHGVARSQSIQNNPLDAVLAVLAQIKGDS